MKKSLLGISVLLFANLFQLCSTGMEVASLVIGIAGITITTFSVIERKIKPQYNEVRGCRTNHNKRKSPSG